VLVNCNNIQVTDLDLSNTTVGVELWLTNHTAISRNKMSHDEYGIMLQSSCTNCINKNEITGNDYGVRLLSSTDNDLTENTLSGNGEGLFLDSANNRIYHNAFIGNVKEASVRDLPNAWDNGYPSGGNYWSNYVGADTFRGSQQDETGSDGIGDTSYMINENNIDKYPLMNRWLIETIKGDLNHDGTVSIFDIVAATSIYGCRNGDPNWNPEADLASPYGRIDIYDLLTCVGQYGKKHP
jgi:parallel beta-helix repeat protein